MSASSVPTLRLQSGYEIPVLGFGTYFGTAKDYEPDTVRKSVESAIELGYRHIDTAALYQTEPIIGQALKNKMADGTIKREDVFITSKLPFSNHHPDDVLPCLEKSLQDLGVTYLDLYLIHTPFASARPDKDEKPDPASASGIKLSTTNDHVLTWKALEECVKKGLVRSLGVSNFNKRQIQNILDNCTVKPVMNQVEVQPYFSNAELIKFCHEKGVAVTAYTPLGQPHESWRPKGWVSAMENPVVKKIAESHNKSPAQVVMKFQLQRGLVVVAKATSRNRQQENFQLFDFELSPQDMKEIHQLNKNARMNIFPSFNDHKDYPFNDPY